MIPIGEIAPFDEPEVEIDDNGQFLLDLDGYGGPIDVLLTLATVGREINGIELGSQAASDKLR